MNLVRKATGTSALCWTMNIWDMMYRQMFRLEYVLEWWYLGSMSEFSILNITQSVWNLRFSFLPRSLLIMSMMLMMIPLTRLDYTSEFLILHITQSVWNWDSLLDYGLIVLFWFLPKFQGSLFTTFAAISILYFSFLISYSIIFQQHHALTVFSLGNFMR